MVLPHHFGIIQIKPNCSQNFRGLVLQEKSGCSQECSTEKKDLPTWAFHASANGDLNFFSLKLSKTRPKGLLDPERVFVIYNSDLFCSTRSSNFTMLCNTRFSSFTMLFDSRCSDFTMLCNNRFSSFTMLCAILDLEVAQC